MIKEHLVVTEATASADGFEDPSALATPSDASFTNRREFVFGGAGALAVALGLPRLAQAFQQEPRKEREEVRKELIKDAGEFAQLALFIIDSTPAPYEKLDPRNVPEIKSMIARWEKYARAFSTAVETNQLNGFKKEQEEFATWVRGELKREGLVPPSVVPSAPAHLREYAEKIEVLVGGLEALFAKRGVVLEGGEQKYLVDESSGAPNMLSFRELPTRFFGIEDMNPEKLIGPYPHLTKEKVPLATIRRIGGQDYKRTAQGTIDGVGSFCRNATAFVNLDNPSSTVPIFREAKDGYIRNFSVLYNRPLLEVVNLIEKRPQDFARKGDSIIERLKDGGLAIDRLLYHMGTNGGSGEFKWEGVEKGQFAELATHEGRHVLDRRNRNPSQVVLEQGKQPLFPASFEERVESEAIIEIKVRVDSMRHAAPFYLAWLIAESRAPGGFEDRRGTTVNTLGAGNAKYAILEAIKAELRENPGVYGITLKPTSRLGNSELNPDEQIMAQIDAFVYSKELTNRMADAVLGRTKVSERAGALVNKFGPQIKKY